MEQGTVFLYGAAIQGIQSFILQTNELKDIVGASELVEQICTTKFAEVLGVSYDSLKKDENAIQMAAGNIKYIFEDGEKCKAFVEIFPKIVLEMAPGITMSQAVVKTKDTESDVEQAVKDLESKLRIQRNKPMQSLTVGLMGIRRSRKTGLPVVKYDENSKEYWDEATTKKRTVIKKGANRKLCEKSFGIKITNDNQIPLDIKKLTVKNDWIAIVHADGNGLGEIVRKIGGQKKDFKKFSEALNDATIAAANSVFKALIPNHSHNVVIPIRPVVLGGDDLTVICSADIAIPYTKKFLEEFEKETEARLGEDILQKYGVFSGGGKKLTACAGIAFIKSSFPFHYGYKLAEELCTRAKKDAKDSTRKINGMAASCLYFHKVQSSFVEEFNQIMERELIPQEGHSLEFGPYYLQDALPKGRWSVDQLQQFVELLADENPDNNKEGSAVKTHLREWLTLLFDNVEIAKQKTGRVLSVINNEKLKELVKKATTPVERENDKATTKNYPAYDLLSLYSIIYQRTK